MFDAVDTWLISKASPKLKDSLTYIPSSFHFLIEDFNFDPPRLLSSLDLVGTLKISTFRLGDYLIGSSNCYQEPETRDPCLSSPKKAGFMSSAPGAFATAIFFPEIMMAPRWRRAYPPSDPMSSIHRGCRKAGIGARKRNLTLRRYTSGESLHQTRL